MSTPTLRDGSVTIRPIRLRDARVLERELATNRSWLRQWEATNPHGPVSFDTRASCGQANNSFAGTVPRDDVSFTNRTERIGSSRMNRSASSTNRFE